MTTHSFARCGWFRRATLLSVALLTAQVWLWSADSSAPATAAPPAEAEAHGKTLWELFEQTGAVGWMLAGLSMIGTSLLIKYMLEFTSRRLSSVELIKRVEGLLAEGDIEGAYEAAQGDNSYAARVFAGALKRRNGGYNEVRDGLMETAAHETFRINARISYLSLVGNVGPLLGLLGTVTGMISSFQVIEKLAAPTPGDLAKGVYESLVNTTIGLFISIVFLSAYFFMKNKISDLTLAVNNDVATVLSNAYVLEPAPGGSTLGIPTLGNPTLGSPTLGNTEQRV